MIFIKSVFFSVAYLIFPGVVLANDFIPNHAEHELSQPIVKLSQGVVRGLREGSVNIFRGVPYARAKRFQQPEAPVHEIGIREAINSGPLCPQQPTNLDFGLGKDESLPTSEDCQNLSIYTPGLKTRLPVMIWLHGGAFLNGGGELAKYDFRKLSQEQQIVTVSISYRLGALGFLYLPEKGVVNLGLQDQIAALNWVSENIEKFGGDPNNITVFGQSAGAVSISAIMSSNPGLIHRAILQSDLLDISVHTPVMAEINSKAFLKELGVDPMTATIEQILQAQLKVQMKYTQGAPFAPVFEDGSLSNPPQNTASPSDILIGWNQDDAAPFAAMMQHKSLTSSEIWWQNPLSAKLTHQLLENPSRNFAKAWKRTGTNVIFYQINWRPSGSKIGAGHCVELPLLSGNESHWHNAPLLGNVPWSEVENRGRQLRQAWAAFAKDGTPPVASEWLSVEH